MSAPTMSAEALEVLKALELLSQSCAICDGTLVGTGKPEWGRVSGDNPEPICWQCLKHGTFGCALCDDICATSWYEGDGLCTWCYSEYETDEEDDE